MAEAPASATTSTSASPPTPSFGGVAHALEAAASIVPGLVAGECWVKSEFGAWDELIALYCPTQLSVRHSSEDGAEVLRVVDTRLAAAFAASHTLSLRLAENAAARRVVEWCYDMSGDDLLKRLTFPVSAALAVPVLADALVSATSSSSASSSNSSSSSAAASTGSAVRRPECIAVMVFYSSVPTEVSMAWESGSASQQDCARDALDIFSHFPQPPEELRPFNLPPSPPPPPSPYTPL